MTFTQAIKMLRRRAKLSQQEVADAIGIARATYIKRENGTREARLDELRKLSQYYEISLQDLADGNIIIEDMNEVELPSVVSEERTDVIPREIAPNYQPEKLRQVLLYILNKVGGKPNVGETVLYKLLYFIDFDYYEKYGQSVTGLEYYHNHFGPTPKTRDFRALVQNMEQAGELEVVTTEYFNNKQKKYLAVAAVKLDRLNAQEIKHIDSELDRLSDKTATELSELSHRDTPWIVASPHKPIDYRDTFYRTDATAVTESSDEL